MPNIRVLNELTIKQNGITTTYKLGTVNGYYNPTDGKFYEEVTHITEIEGLPNLVYADIAGNALYIYKTATSSFVKVSGSGGSADNLKFGYLNDEDGKFYEDDQYQVEILGNADYLFIGLDNDTIYRYDTTNTAFVSIGGGGGGIEYQAGTGIDITDDVISGDYKGGFNIKIDGDEISTKTFVGTQAEWDNLTSAQKAKFDVVSITDDSTTLNNTPGHGIVDSTGTDMPQRSKLQFADATITDDATNDVTIVTHDPYTAGDKIDITNREISCDKTVKGTFIGTKAEWDALSAADKAKYDIVNLTDDEITPASVVDAVADGNMNPVTSNAVSKELYKKDYKIWGNSGSRFFKISNAYPNKALQTNEYFINNRQGEAYLVICGMGGNDTVYITPTIIQLARGLERLAFYWNSTTGEIACEIGSYGYVMIQQISGNVADFTLSDLSTTNPLIDPIAVIPKKIAPQANNAGSHNSIYRGQYLGSEVTSAQYAEISAGTFEDMYIGDYWTINNVKYRIAAFDYWLNTGSTQCTTHHVVIVPDTCFAAQKMNDTATTDGGYSGSQMYTTYLNAAKSTINTAFGSSHILTRKALFTTQDNWAWVDSTVDLMSEYEVFGCNIWGSNAARETGARPFQFPLFRLNPSFIASTYSGSSVNYWLRGVHSSSEFCYVNTNGSAQYSSATGYLQRRPCFAIIG